MTATDPRPEPAPAEGGAPQGSAPQGSAPQSSAPQGSAPQGGAPGSGPASEPTRRVLPEQAREDTDAAWGEYPEQDNERLHRDRPPHWADF